MNKYKIGDKVVFEDVFGTTYSNVIAINKHKSYYMYMIHGINNRCNEESLRLDTLEELTNYWKLP